MIKRCPLCDTPLSQYNPNKYCFVHVRVGVESEIEAELEEQRLRQLENCHRYLKKKREAKKLKGKI